MRIFALFLCQTGNICTLTDTDINVLYRKSKNIKRNFDSQYRNRVKKAHAAIEGKKPLSELNEAEMQIYYKLQKKYKGGSFSTTDSDAWRRFDDLAQWPSIPAAKQHQ